MLSVAGRALWFWAPLTIAVCERAFLIKGCASCSVALRLAQEQQVETEVSVSYFAWAHHNMFQQDLHLFALICKSAPLVLHKMTLPACARFQRGLTEITTLCVARIIMFTTQAILWSHNSSFLKKKNWPVLLEAFLTEWCCCCISWVLLECKHMNAFSVQQDVSPGFAH